MARNCKTFDHTADVGLSAEADTLGEIFEALAEGMADFICPRSQVQPLTERTLELTAEDEEALAVDFLSEILLMMQTQRFMPASVKVTADGDGSLAACLRGETYDPYRHEIETEVKAVTYHELRIAREKGRWVGQVILDI